MKYIEKRLITEIAINQRSSAPQVLSMQQRFWYKQPAYTQRQSLVTVRRVGPHDCQLLTDLLARLSDRSYRLRYMLPWPRAVEALEHEARRMLIGATGDHISCRPASRK
jgi:hypothetical protein